jgi:nitroimidazol reductase NimA-like FMN-containing flavoprotein (pyridoxamine 5'-phosphate oxidase superfamily)
MRRADREISGTEEIEQIINRADVCRIAIANDNYPYLVTMNFGYMNSPARCLYFHCATQGKKLDMIRKNKYVCFEMDIDHRLLKGEKSCDWGMGYTSVLGYGNLSIVDSRNERIAGLNVIMEHYGKHDNNDYNEKILERTVILRLDITEITGKKKL